MNTETEREPNLKAVRRIIVLQQNPDGSFTPTTVYRKKSKRKKISKRMRPIEKRARRISKGLATLTSEYTQRHNRSNRKKKNGWLKDIRKNVRKSAKSGRKKAKIKRLF